MQISNSCFTEQEFQAFSKLALFDDDVVISADALEAKQVVNGAPIPYLTWTNNRCNWIVS